MPTFDNSSNDSMLSREFLERFEDWCELAAYDNARKARALRYALTGAAQTWWTSAHRGTTHDMMNWAQAQAAFRARFIKAPSARVIDAELEKLTQKQKEPVLAYLDRVKTAVSLLQDLWPVPPADAGAVRQAKLTANGVVHDALVLQFFLRSLRPDIKSGIAQAPNLITLNDYTQAAVRAEELLSEMKTPSTAPTVLPVEAEVANTEAKQKGTRNKKSKKKTSASSGSSITPSSGNPNAKATSPSPNTTPPSGYVCRICNIAGHWIQYCPNKGAQQRQGQAQQFPALPARPVQAVGVQPVVPQPGFYSPALLPHPPMQRPSSVPEQYLSQQPQPQPHPQPSPGFDIHELSHQSPQPFH